MIDPKKIAYERAKFARDIEYLQSMAEDTYIQESMIAIEEMENSKYIKETENDPELIKAIDQIPVDDGVEDEEIDRILASDKNMNIDDVIGISDNILDSDNSDI